MIYSALFLASFFVSSSALFFVENNATLAYQWDSYKQEYNKDYGSAEEDMKRFQVFMSNLKLIDERNEKDTAVHGINKFSDLTLEEFSSRYLNSKPDVGMQADKKVLSVVPPYTGPESLIDWTGVFTTPVKDQGYCGSCWAFSATEQIESDSMRQLHASYLLSPAQITQCAKGSAGCGGGWTETAYAYVKNSGGLEQEKDYPYTTALYQGITGTCTDTPSKFVIGITGYTTITGETNMASYVKSTGPLSVCVDAMTWNTYKGGIMSNCGKQIDHCVQAVGVDDSTGGYWKVRNSWGTSWGESGFIRLAYGQNTCGITNDPTYVDTVLVK